MPGRGSPPGQTMRHWKPSEDVLLLALTPDKSDSTAPRWPTIAANFNRETTEPPRPVKALRNRFLRLHKGALIRNAGKGKNRCNVCYQIKIGHVCPGPPPPPRIDAAKSDDEEPGEAVPALEVWAQPSTA